MADASIVEDQTTPLEGPGAAPPPSGDDALYGASSNTAPASPVQEAAMPSAPEPKSFSAFAAEQDKQPDATNDNAPMTFDKFAAKQEERLPKPTLGFLPSWNQFKEDQPQHFWTSPQELSPVQRDMVSNTMVGRFMSAIGHGVADPFDRPLETNPWEGDATPGGAANKQWFDKYIKSTDVPGAAFTQGVLLPAVSGFWRFLNESLPGAFMGALNSAGKDLAPFPSAGGVDASGKGIGYSDLGEDVMGGLMGGELGIPHGVRELEAQRFASREVSAAQAMVAPVAEKLNLGEGVYFGTKEPTPEQQRAVEAATNTLPPRQPVAPVVAPDIHQLARSFAPEIFGGQPGGFEGYDALSARRDAQGQQLREAVANRQSNAEASSPYAGQIAELEANPQTGKREKPYQAKLDDLRDKHDAWVEAEIAKDSPEVSAAREAYQKTDYAMRDLAPSVAAAYRSAAEKLPKAETVEHEPENEPLTVSKYVDDYISGKGRNSKEHEQFAANNAGEIEAEFNRRKESEAGLEAKEPGEVKGETATKLTPKEQEIAASPEVKAAAASAPIIDRTKDVKLGAGASIDGKKVYIDKDLPHEIDIGNGVKADPAKFIAIHEMAEHAAMQRGEAYDPAHNVGLTYEHEAVRAAGGDIPTYEENLAPAVKHAATKELKNTPDDVYMKEYTPEQRDEMRAAQVGKETTAPTTPENTVHIKERDRLLKAGRPVEEAETLARVAQTMYETLAKQLGISVDEAYEKYRPGKFVGARKAKEKAGELAQDGKSAEPFYSALQRSLRDIKQGKATSEQWKGIINNLTQKGVKKEEIEWSGVNEWLDSREGQVTKEELQKFLEKGGVQLQEVTKGGAPYEEFVNRMVSKYGDDWVHKMNPDELTEKDSAFENGSEDRTKFSNYQLPGGKNYREMLLTLPIEDELNRKEKNQYRSSHFDEPNILAHIRMNDRIDADGNKVLFVEEVQSDWHQKGRKQGYATDDMKALDKKYESLRNDLSKAQEDLRKLLKKEDNLGFDRTAEAVNAIKEHEDFADRWNMDGELLEKANQYRGLYKDTLEIERDIKRERVPDAPFKKTWQELAMKRVLRYAAEHDYDKVAWTTGEQQAERYDLTKYLNEIAYWKQDDGKYGLAFLDKNDRPIDSYNPKENIEAKDLENHVGKEIAKKIVNDEGDKKPKESGYLEGGKLPDGVSIIKGNNIKVGGGGMKGFYDKILPDFMNKYTKKWGGKVEKSNVSNRQELYRIKNGDRVIGDGYPNMDQVNDDLASAQNPEALSVEKYSNELEHPINSHAISITDSMRDSVLQGQPLFQGAKQGSYVRNANPAQAIIKFFKGADASTFLHEMAHHWFDLMDHLSRQEGIPEAIKQDLSVAKQWMGIPEDADIMAMSGSKYLYERQLEKFARGFERYLYEGVAPRADLVPVFAKIKQWMTAIYNTVRKLKNIPEISPEIRGVFDRMLGEESKKTIIAPDHEPGKMMADVHEADAVTTPPAQAASVADNVHREMDSTAKLHEPEIADVLKEAEKSATTAEGAEVPAVGESGGVAAQATSAPEAGPGTQPPAGAGGAAQEPNAIGTGGSQSAAEGGSARSAEPGAGGNTARSAAKPEPGPNTIIPESKSDTVDKAGNIRLENLTLHEEVRTAMRNAAEKLGLNERTPVTDAMMLDYANAAGVEGDEVNLTKLKQAAQQDGIPLAARIIVGRRMLLDSATQGLELMRRIKNGEKGLIEELAIARDRHLMIMETVSDITAQWGRAGRAFRDISKEEFGHAEEVGELFQKMTGMTPEAMEHMAKEGAVLDTAGKFSKYLKDSTKSNFADKLLEYRDNSLLSGPITHIRYVFGGIIGALYKPLVQIPSAVLVQRTRTLLTGVEPVAGGKIYLGEAGAMLHAMGTGSVRGWMAAKEAWRSGYSEKLPTEGVVPRKILSIQKKLQATDLTEKNRASLQKDLSDLQDIQKKNDLASAKTAMTSKAGKVVNTSMRGINSIHSFQKTLRYEQNKAGLSFRQAMDEGLEQNSKEFKDRVSDLQSNPSPEMMDKASTAAVREVYMNPVKGGGLIGDLSNAAGKSRLGRALFPFVKMRYNILREELIENLPTGVLSQEMRDTLSGKIGITEAEKALNKDMAIGKMLAGTSVVGAGLVMTSMGITTGSGPSDPAQYKTWRLTHTPNSIYIGGMAVPLQVLGLPGRLMILSANLHDSVTEAWDDVERDRLDKAAGPLVEFAARTALEDNIMSSMSDMLNAGFHHEQYGDQYIKNLALQWIPFGVGLGQVAKEIDPYMRDTKSFGDAVIGHIPFVSEELPARYDVFGNPVLQGETYDKYNNDPVVFTLERLRTGISPLKRDIQNVPLTDDQYAAYTQKAGTLTYQRLHDLVSSDYFQAAPHGVQLMQIKRSIEGARYSAVSFMTSTYPEILIKAQANRRLKYQ